MDSMGAVLYKRLKKKFVHKPSQAQLGMVAEETTPYGKPNELL